VRLRRKGFAFTSKSFRVYDVIASRLWANGKNAIIYGYNKGDKKGVLVLCKR